MAAWPKAGGAGGENGVSMAENVAWQHGINVAMAGMKISRRRRNSSMKYRKRNGENG
jgi:hypothetical protein